jgi:hypothetical protein
MDGTGIVRGDDDNGPVLFPLFSEQQRIGFEYAVDREWNRKKVSLKRSPHMA